MTAFALRRIPLLPRLLLLPLCLVGGGLCPLRADEPLDRLRRGEFRWTATPPLVAPVERPEDRCFSVKDPTVVRHDGRWHLFSTIRSEQRTHQIEYAAFEDWEAADAAPRTILTLLPGYFCAPQVFYFRPQERWYLVYQVEHPQGKPTLLPAFSTSETVGDPASWSAPQLMFDERPDSVSSWIDFWVVCDESRAHLFFTSNDGRFWRCDTLLEAFPRGWSDPRVVLAGDIFEASCTYRLKGTDSWLTIIEAVGDRGRRYYKAYLADSLDGDWTPIADTPERPFAAPRNVAGADWTTSFSHGELLRSSNDERLEVDPANLEFLYQGVSDAEREGVPYGRIPWRLGLLRSVP
ncbi:MAG: hypothetical protein KF774_15315 [Planctomyces sp.]|nr:hypothetical protein [Planctomyces sp.]